MNSVVIIIYAQSRAHSDSNFNSTALWQMFECDLLTQSTSILLVFLLHYVGTQITLSHKITLNFNFSMLPTNGVHFASIGDTSVMDIHDHCVNSECSWHSTSMVHIP